jgi:serine O-acetyltransferase
MKEYNKKDLYRYEGNKCHSLKTQIRYLLGTPGFQYSYALRHAQNASDPISKVFWVVVLRLMMYFTSIQIPAQTRIGEGLKFSHWGTIVVNQNAVIGRNFSISNGCVIGSAQGKRKGYPTIGNNVTINANSVIVGGVKIGNNVLVAPNVFINFDVPDNCIVIGNPGQIIPKNYPPSSRYIVYNVEDY